MALEDILRAMDIEGAEERKAIIKNATQKADEIVASAQEEAEKIRQSKMEKMLLSLNGEKARILNEARLYQKKCIIEEKERIINEVFDIVEEKLKKIRESENYKLVIEHLLKEVIKDFEEKYEIHVCGKDIEVVESIIGNEKKNCVIVPDETGIGGFKVYLCGGKIIIDNLFETRLRKARSILKTQIASMLFG